MKDARSRSLILAVMLSGTALVAVSFAGQTERQSREKIAATKGVDATNWGTDIFNPFTNLTADGKEQLKAAGVDVDRLSKLKAVLITGSYTGANSKTFVNRDPNAVLVLGKGFKSHGDVYSNGPILLIENADIRERLIAADLVWFVEDSSPRGKIAGSPIVLAPSVSDRRMKAKSDDVRHGNYGWRRPDNFLQRPVNRKSKLPPLAVADADNRRKELRGQIEATRGVDTADWCDCVVNPFSNLTAEGKAMLMARGIDPERLTKLKAVLLTGSYYGVDSKTFINHDSDVVLIIGKGFGSHGDILSLGPILAAENSKTGTVVGADLIWFVEESFPKGKTTGLPVILTPSVHDGQMERGSDEVWHGDYGWRRPDDFLKVIAEAPRKQASERVAAKAQEQHIGQESGGEEDRTEKLKQEMRRIDVALKAGDEVVALRDAQLMVEAKSVGGVRKREKLTVEQAQDNWLWVRSGEIRGWIDRRSVMSEQLADWYQRLPNNEAVTVEDDTRGRYNGVYFEMINWSPSFSCFDRSFGHIRETIERRRGTQSGPILLGENMSILIERQDAELIVSISFLRFSGRMQDMPTAVNATRRYGTVQQGDYVFIDTKTRLVLVNGERRRLQ